MIFLRRSMIHTRQSRIIRWTSKVYGVPGQKSRDFCVFEEKGRASGHGGIYGVRQSGIPDTAGIAVSAKVGYRTRRRLRCPPKWDAGHGGSYGVRQRGIPDTAGIACSAKVGYRTRRRLRCPPKWEAGHGGSYGVRQRGIPDTAGIAVSAKYKN